ncbi:MAG: winged helix-turn-helix domain-containing protein [Candidatus Eremiobacteraeota bacterium]|nr:winged helix-turn-helix domain-containing protein [Candidatus Eremiobacteraeota bacterium]
MAPRVVFGPFAFDREELALWQDGVAVPLTPKVAEALGILLVEPGALVTKERLRESLWPDGFVEDGNLTQTIYLLRKALDPEGDGRAFVDTVPRRGYRFVAPFTLVEPPPSKTRGLGLPLRTIRLRLAFAALFVVLLLGGSLIEVAQSRNRLYPGLSVESSREYALGRYYWNKRSLDATHTSIAYFEDVVRLSPRSALGYAGLADSYVMIANHAMVKGDLKPYYKKAEQYADQALQRDPQSGEALATLGFIAYDRDHDRNRAERLLRMAIALRPLYASAHEFLGVILLERGNVVEGTDETKRAAELDPLSSPILLWVGIAYYYEHHFEEGRRVLHQAIDLDPHNGSAMWYLALTDERLGQTGEALATIAQDRREMANSHFHEKNEDAELNALTALVALHDGNEKLAMKMLPDLKPRAKPKVDVAIMAALCARLDRRDDAYEWWRIGVHDKEMGWVTRAMLPYDPQLTELAGDDRFRAILQT